MVETCQRCKNPDCPISPGEDAGVYTWCCQKCYWNFERWKESLPVHNSVMLRAAWFKFCELEKAPEKNDATSWFQDTMGDIPGGY